MLKFVRLTSVFAPDTGETINDISRTFVNA